MVSGSSFHHRRQSSSSRTASSLKYVRLEEWVWEWYIGGCGSARNHIMEQMVWRGESRWRYDHYRCFPGENGCTVISCLAEYSLWQYVVLSYHVILLFLFKHILFCRCWVLMNSGQPGVPGIPPSQSSDNSSSYPNTAASTTPSSLANQYTGYSYGQQPYNYANYG